MTQPIVLHNVRLLGVKWDGPQHTYEIEIEGHSRVRIKDENCDGTGPFVLSFEKSSPPNMGKMQGVPSGVVSYFRQLLLNTGRSESILAEVKGFLKDGRKRERVTKAAAFDYDGDGKADAINFTFSDRLLGEIAVDMSTALLSDRPVIQDGRLIYRRVDRERQGVWLLDIFDPLFAR